MRFAVEHVLAKLAAGETVDTILMEYPILEPEDVQACLLYAYRSVAGEHVFDRNSPDHAPAMPSPEQRRET